VAEVQRKFDRYRSAGAVAESGTHFYSERKNSEETIKLIELLRHQYRSLRRIYLSWDAAPWHSSKELKEKIASLNGAAAADGYPDIQMLSLPAGAQFLNVIESVFSGCRAPSFITATISACVEAQAAISRYFEERNAAFLAIPRRAGRAIWGEERVPSAFVEANNCKDPKYR
jgi:DDE superfamily endonuclease